jgi:transcriptional regulator with XRE-family HTH domain
MKQVIDNIKKFRELKNVTREHIASELEMSLSGYSKLERGEVDLTLSKLYRIAEVLEVSVSQILNFDVTNVFNVSNNQNVHGVEVREQHNYSSSHTEKYIQLLESEVERLKAFEPRKKAI